MKKFAIAALSLLLIISLFACGGEKASFEAYPKTEIAGETAVKEYDELTVTYPAAYTIGDSTDTLTFGDASAADFSVLAPQNDNGSISNFILLTAMGSASAKITDVTEAYVKNQLQAPSELKSFGYYNLGGADAAIYTITTEQNGMNIELTQALVLKDGKNYIFTLNIFDGNYESELKAILSNVVFK